jgi:SAM-dependent methyltransferase
MARDIEEQALTERFAEQYRLAQSDVVLEIERAVCGSDYGGTSWTTRAEAGRVADLLGLGPGTRLLEVGAGSGWPGLYLARTTGCDATLIDVPLDGLRIAAGRALADEPAGGCWIAAADGTALPFGDGCFDAVSHSDVLCCLDAKPALLRACRRVVREHGKMVFSVISVAPGLSPADHERAVAAGPPCIASAVPYPDMLRQTGWEIVACEDVTEGYAEAGRTLLRAEEAHADRLAELLGEAESSERLARHANALRANEAGLLRRELFVTTAAV